MEERLLSTMKEVFIFYNLGRTSLKWRPRFCGGGLGGEFRMTREEYEKR